MADKKSFADFRTKFEADLQLLKECAERDENPKKVDSLSKFYYYLCQRILLAYDNPEFESEIHLDEQKNIDALIKNKRLAPKRRCSGAVNKIQDIFTEFGRGKNLWTKEQNLMRNLFEDLFTHHKNGLLTIEFVEPLLLNFNISIAAHSN